MYLDKEEKALATTDKFLSSVSYLGDEAMQHYGAAVVCMAEAKKHIEEAMTAAISSAHADKKVTA
ncbi:hypothetical protein [Selenomonas sp.]|uniref:hypothetical protein n=1 Tax=Selenomonas sp. TaxID=2053611 RepID=UPI0025D53477|nr:hypothetical protein [Selenomonas sp.]MCI6284024.1 hypothetical protein [Selenomonas sp.]MDY3298517.1 hypothetical protein [Selenomonas sp.]